MRTISTLLLFFAVTFYCSAQNQVSITINHFLDGESFENNIEAQNDLGDKVKIDRMEYYISDFQVIHDGGQVEKIEDLYVLVSLVNKTDPTKIELGELNVDKLEAISFRLGVDEENNHADPALWPETHPLAPKNPSMHWGWNSGYRFIALEGKCGPAVDEWIQLHCIGDEFHQEVSLSIEESASENYDIHIDGDYIKLLSGIEMKEEVIVHGSTDEIIPAVENFVSNTFSISGIVSAEDHESVTLFEVFPNPVLNQKVSINLESSTEINSIHVFNSVGKLVRTKNVSELNTIEFQNQGMYFISLIGVNGENLATRKVIVL